MDPLLVRTLVGSLPLDALLPILLKDFVPLDVVAATLTHHVKEHSFLKEEIQQVRNISISSCLTAVISIQRTMENIQF